MNELEEIKRLKERINELEQKAKIKAKEEIEGTKLRIKMIERKEGDATVVTKKPQEFINSAIDHFGHMDGVTMSKPGRSKWKGHRYTIRFYRDYYTSKGWLKAFSVKSNNLSIEKIKNEIEQISQKFD